MFHFQISALLTVLLLWMGSSASSSGELESALSKLDQILKEEKAITLRKEARLDSLRTCMEAATSARERYGYMKQLYTEFARYNLDSALYYAHKKEDLAKKIGDQALVNDALNDRADRYIISGMYRYAEAVLDSMVIDSNTSPRRGLTITGRSFPSTTASNSPTRTLCSTQGWTRRSTTTAI